MSTFVVRDTWHPAEDIKRNFSSFAGGGWPKGEFCHTKFASADEAEAAHRNLLINEGWEEEDIEKELRDVAYKFHPAYDSFVMVHFEGLCACQLDADSLEDALIEAAAVEDGLAVTTEDGGGLFFGQDVIAFHEVREGRWIFQLD